MRAFAIAWKSCASDRFRRTNTWCPARARSIEALRERGLRLYLASGTDQPYMREEADLLDVARYFEGRVYGALDDYQSFSKKILIERLIAGVRIRKAAEFLGFGDGYVEIENIKEVGGVAVGVATAEPECRTVDEWKRAAPGGRGRRFHHPQLFVPRRTARRTISQWPVNTSSSTAPGCW